MFLCREFPGTRTGASNCACGGASWRPVSSRAPEPGLCPPVGLTTVGRHLSPPYRSVSSARRRRWPRTRSFLSPRLTKKIPSVATWPESKLQLNEFDSVSPTLKRRQLSRKEWVFSGRRQWTAAALCSAQHLVLLRTGSSVCWLVDWAGAGRCSARRQQERRPAASRWAFQVQRGSVWYMT